MLALKDLGRFVASGLMLVVVLVALCIVKTTNWLFKGA